MAQVIKFDSLKDCMVVSFDSAGFITSVESATVARYLLGIPMVDSEEKKGFLYLPKDFPVIDAVKRCLQIAGDSF